ncbi:hypothetical protein [Brachybacterium tyrofermentans]|uniref:hypothetical protein n=1 Tax=Brachybacterium tyrofermentans TaxID=47848 RepID=UPI00186758BD|nr:hypothetical protein [Brachybacterium tyrofermentans]
MPTFDNPSQDADELAQAARGLAYATRQIETPQETYYVLGSLHLALSRLQQGLQQLAAWHERNAPFAATDDGDRAAGHDHAVKAGGWLSVAAASTDQVVQLVMKAHSENGRIAWQSEAAPTRLAGLADVLAEREAALAPDPPASGHTSQGTGLTR